MSYFDYMGMPKSIRKKPGPKKGQKSGTKRGPKGTWEEQRAFSKSLRTKADRNIMGGMLGRRDVVVPASEEIFNVIPKVEPNIGRKPGVAITPEEIQTVKGYGDSLNKHGDGTGGPDPLGGLSKQSKGDTRKKERYGKSPADYGRLGTLHESNRLSGPGTGYSPRPKGLIAKRIGKRIAKKVPGLAVIIGAGTIGKTMGNIRSSSSMKEFAQKQWGM